MADGVTIKWDTAKWDRFTVRFPFELTREEAPLALKRVVFEFLRRAIQRTPVDTGRAQAGWLPYAEANGLPIGVTGPGVAQGRSEGSYRQQMGAQGFIEIVNGVPYILFLEYGSSGQAANGMVRITMRELSGQKVTAKEMGMAVRRAAKSAGAR